MLNIMSITIGDISRNVSCFLLTSARSKSPKILINKKEKTPLVFEVPEESVNKLTVTPDGKSYKFILAKD